MIDEEEEEEKKEKKEKKENKEVKEKKEKKEVKEVKAETNVMGWSPTSSKSPKPDINDLVLKKGEEVQEVEEFVRLKQSK